MIVIPTFPGVPLYRERVQLDGRDFTLAFDWAEREGRWYLSLYDSQDAPVRLGIKLVANWPLLMRAHHNPAVPPGQLLAISLEDSEPPVLEDLGTRVKLYYFTEAEIAAEAAA